MSWEHWGFIQWLLAHTEEGGGAKTGCRNLVEPVGAVAAGGELGLDQEHGSADRKAECCGLLICAVAWSIHPHGIETSKIKGSAPQQYWPISSAQWPHLTRARCVGQRRERIPLSMHEVLADGSGLQNKVEGAGQ